MTWKTNYISDESGKVRKISELEERLVGNHIKTCYATLRTTKVLLNHLHERLWVIRQEKDSSVSRTDTSSKILKTMGFSEVQKDWKEREERIQRLETILGLALSNLNNDEDKEVVRLILKNYEVKKDD